MRRLVLWLLAAALFLAVPAIIVLILRPAGPPPPPEPDVLLYDDASGAYLKLPLETYLAGVVAAEMPASFDLEAMKAQAVVARTYAVRHLRAFGGGGCAAHPPADVCSSPEESQAWLSESELRKRWGREFPAYWRKVNAAVRATRGLIALYGGEPIDAVYFAASGGRTEDARYVWGHVVPYLKSVPSPGERDPYEGATARFTWAEVAARLGIDPDAFLARPPSARFAVLSRTPSGRAFYVRAGAEILRATDVRARLGLRSTWIVAVEADRQGLTLHTKGWGHGVGLSQYGAQAMAERGRDFRAIVRWYYQGVEVEPWTEWAGSTR
ncbi:MAG: stage II sporulation protein D [Clostridia bacterium]|nr:stage II sporulation protein D [Clostridia bacterium]